MEHVAMKVDITGEWNGNHLQCLHALNEGVGEQSAMLDAESWILFRVFFLDLLIDPKSSVNGKIPIGMRGELPSRRVRLAPGVVKLLAAGELQSNVLIWDSNVGS